MEIHGTNFPKNEFKYFDRIRTRRPLKKKTIFLLSANFAYQNLCSATSEIIVISHNELK